jgi:glyoxylase-like metal-dependent hydrolase (beta-lactamase superfamily II)
VNFPLLPIDLNFQDEPGLIASYLIPFDGGAALVESGPASTLPALKTGLQTHGYTLDDITHLFLTHIHLDHAGAAGHLAALGTQVYVHGRGAPHLIDPTKLIASASRIYGDQMDTLWGEIRPIPAEQVHILEDGAEVTLGGLCLRAIETPGHARHHHAYRVGDGVAGGVHDVLFTGDVAGIRLSANPHLRLPTPPPEFDPVVWAASLRRLQQETVSRLALTHFGLFDDAAAHLQNALDELAAIQGWIWAVEPLQLDPEALQARFVAWAASHEAPRHLPAELTARHELTNATAASGAGVVRYLSRRANSAPTA